ncbi:hypothetical protein FWF89_02545 [Candidatus Saccharibacteria bacterium]|nr:hypothetical protein [Candidatus Saccharibacteria bacterium]
MGFLQDMLGMVGRDVARGAARGAIEKTTGVDPYNAGTVARNRVKRKIEEAGKKKAKDEKKGVAEKKK